MKKKRRREGEKEGRREGGKERRREGEKEELQEEEKKGGTREGGRKQGRREEAGKCLIYHPQSPQDINCRFLRLYINYSAEKCYAYQFITVQCSTVWSNSV